MRLWSKRRSQSISKHAQQDAIRPDSWSLVEDHDTETRTVRLRGIPDRSQFESRLDEELAKARCSGEDLTLVYLDLDDFKRLCDAHGPAKMRDALTLVSRTLRSNARDTDLVAHYGNDEFAVLMSEASLVEARRFFDSIREEVLERSASALGFEIHLSAGAVKFLAGSRNIQSVMEAVDYAVYVAKRQGKNRLFATVAIYPKPGKREVRMEV